MNHLPEPGNAIVKVPTSEYGDVPVNMTTFHSVTYGEIVLLHPDDMKEKSYMVGTTGHWHKYQDDISLDGGYAVVELKDIKAITAKESK